MVNHFDWTTLDHSSCDRRVAEILASFNYALIIKANSSRMNETCLYKCFTQLTCRLEILLLSLIFPFARRKLELWPGAEDEMVSGEEDWFGSRVVEFLHFASEKYFENQYNYIISHKKKSILWGFGVLGKRAGKSNIRNTSIYKKIN